MAALRHEVHVVLWHLRKAKVHNFCIMPTAIKMFLHPLRIVAEQKYSAIAHHSGYVVQGTGIILCPWHTMEGLHLGIADIISPTDMQGNGVGTVTDTLGHILRTPCRQQGKRKIFPYLLGKIRKIFFTLPVTVQSDWRFDPFNPWPIAEMRLRSNMRNYLTIQMKSPLDNLAEFVQKTARQSWSTTDHSICPNC